MLLRKLWWLGSVLFDLFCRKKNKGMFVRVAKRVRDTEGGVSQCVACEAPQRSEARRSPTRRETPKKSMYYYRTI